MGQAQGNGDPTGIRGRFGKAVASRRRELGLTQERLAERARLHRTYVAEIELGKRNVSLVNIERLARALPLPISNLFSEYHVEDEG